MKELITSIITHLLLTAFAHNDLRKPGRECSIGTVYIEASETLTCIVQCTILAIYSSSSGFYILLFLGVSSEHNVSTKHNHMPA